MESPAPIAIVGMSCRFAGDIDNPEKLWRLLAEGRSAWSEIPKERFNLDGVFHPNSEKLNGVCSSTTAQQTFGREDANTLSSDECDWRSFSE